MFQVTIMVIIDDREGSISVPTRKLATLLMPKMDHPMIAFSNANFFRLMNAWISDNNNPAVTISPKTKKKGDMVSNPVKSR